MFTVKMFEIYVFQWNKDKKMKAGHQHLQHLAVLYFLFKHDHYGPCLSSGEGMVCHATFQPTFLPYCQQLLGSVKDKNK